MSGRQHDYGFQDYLAGLSTDWYDDDDLLHRLLDHYAPGGDRSRLQSFGPRVAGELRILAETSALPENAPRLLHRDAYDDRVDVVSLPGSTREALHIAHGDEGLGAVRGDPFTHYAMVYLLAQNGEGGVACSVACTDGLVRALEVEPGIAGRPVDEGADPAAGETSGPTFVRKTALDTVLESSPDGYAHAAQFVTEIQGGSDVPANRVRALRDDADGYRIEGQKWFCSNINADWFLVTARAGEGERGPVGLFLVPAYIGGRRNGYIIDRLKDKLGTRELATAEVVFDGARAWSVGPPEQGLRHLLRYVLTPSRYACVLFAAGALRRAERIATDYAAFREAFGRPIDRYPLVRRTLEALSESRSRALTGSFELLRLWQAAESSGYQSRDSADFRVLLSLAKPVLTRLATDQLHEAMTVLGGNGIEERFSPLPRLYRDSVIMETWEGPHNVLFTQAARDLRRFDMEPGAFLQRVTGAEQPALSRQLDQVVATEDPGEAALILADAAPGIIRALGERAAIAL